MWNKKQIVQYILYRVSAAWLPESNHSKICKNIRGYWVKHIVQHTGYNVNIERGARFTPELVIGNNSGIGIDCEVYGPVEIGHSVMMGPEVIIYTRNHKHHSDKLFIEQGYDNIEPVKIGNNVWIGRRAMFMPGSSVGDDSIVAAGAIVTKKFGDKVIIGGVPARIIGYIQL